MFVVVLFLRLSGIFSKDMKTSTFIVIAGCEGSGKTTQIEKLRKKYPEAVFFREPGGTEFAEEIRRLMLSSSHSTELNSFQQMNLAFVGRTDNIKKIIGPAMECGKLIFADRFDCCSFAYQIFGMEGKNLFDHFDSSRLSMGSPKYLPDIYIFLDISPEEGMRRVAMRAEAKGDINHFDKRGLEFHARVREGYKRFAELHSSQVKVVDGHPAKEEVWKSIEAVLDKFLATR